MRLVDADAYKAEGRELYREAGWDLREVHYSQLDTEFNIDMMPTIEAVSLEDYRSMEQTVHKLTQAIAEAEPKHGRWLPSDKGDCTHICSECGFVRDAYVLEEKAFCPHCGAPMDGQQEVE